MLKLSIITINYNNLEGLKKTFTSVFEQNYNNFEYIVIDGGSTDGSKELIVQNTDQLAHWVSEPDNGIYHAMNKGIEKAKGMYTLFLNSGDEFADSSILSYINDFISHHTGIDIFYGDLIFIDENKKTRKNHIYTENLSLYYFHNNSIGHPASFIKTSLLKEKKYNTNYNAISDWLFFIECFISNKKFLKIPKIISKFYLGGISSNNEKIFLEHRQCFNEELAFLKNDILEFQNYNNFKYSRLFKVILRLKSYIK